MSEHSPDDRANRTDPPDRGDDGPTEAEKQASQPGAESTTGEPNTFEPEEDPDTDSGRASGHPT